MSYSKTKDQSIETLRGIAIILVVSGYVIGGDLQSSHSLLASILNFGYFLLKPIRMPLFTVISAYLYAASPATQATFKKLFQGKQRRILIPFIFVSAIQYIFFSVFHVWGPHPMYKIWHIYIIPFEQFWFLLAVFWIFMIVGFLDCIKALDTMEKWATWLILASITHILFEPTTVLAIHGVNYLFPFFLMGYGIKRYNKELFTPSMIRCYLAICLFVYFFYPALYHKYTYEDSFYKFSALFISFTAVPLIFHFRRTIPWLAMVGYYSFGIHIFNKISTGWARMLFEHFHITSTALIFSVYLAFGIFLSIATQIVLEKFNISRKLILGMKDRPEFVVKPAYVSPPQTEGTTSFTEGRTGI
jgi:hypothetical protein